MDGLGHALSCRTEVAKLLVDMKADTNVWEDDKWLKEYMMGVARCDRGGVRWRRKMMLKDLELSMKILVDLVMLTEE
jgi:hypothetical protein